MIDSTKIDSLKKNPSADDIEIDTIETEMGVKLPEVYKELLKYSNGLSINYGVLIYGTQDFIERNLTWEIAEYAKGYIAVGDDGGGNVFLMERDPNSANLYIVDSGYINPNGANLVTSDFIKWINNGCVICKTQNTVNQTNFDTGDIILVTFPEGGLKELITIKNTFGLEVSTNELVKGSKKLPLVLVRDFPYGKATKLIEKLGALGKVLRIEGGRK
ncbi:MAG TPA: 1,3-beta-glucan synthase regulator [Firmicutes bacterium]|nr:1,3-beta-glucan synthase regulator [Bacillota bacterium]